MPARYRLLILAAAVLCAGCSGLRDVWNPPDWSAFLAQDEEERPACARRLVDDKWELRTDWSMTEEWRASQAGIPPVSALRWNYTDWRKPFRDLQLEFTNPESTDSGSHFDWSSLPPPARTAWLNLAQGSDLVAWNALVLAVQAAPLENQAFSPRLAQFVQSPPKIARETDQGRKDELPTMRIRRAAAEAWCLMLAGNAESLASIRNEIGLAASNSSLPDEIRAELILGLARVTPPNKIAPLAPACVPAEPDIEQAPSLELRRAALGACIVYALRHPEVAADADCWPAGIHHFAQVPEASLRGLYGTWLTASRHPQAFLVLKQQMQDTDVAVQRQALENLGRLQSPEARDLLRKQMQQGEEMQRAAAVTGLAAWGADELRPFAKDPSSLVRRTIARQLQPSPSPTAALLLQDILFAGPNLPVEQSVLETIQDWPIADSWPVYAQILTQGTQTSCEVAVSQLARTSGSELVFPSRGTPTEREAALTRLAAEWPPVKDLTLPAPGAANISPSPASSMSSEQLHLWLAQLAPERSAAEHAAAIQILRQLPQSDWLQIERQLETSAPGVANLVVREVFADRHPVYTPLIALTSVDVHRRRTAVQQLVLAAKQAEFSPFAWQQIVRLAQSEQDQHVWHGYLQVWEAQSVPAGDLLVHLALNHPWPDVRRQACDALSRHARPEHARWILPLLADSNREVQLVAISAAVASRHPLVLDGIPGESPGLRPWLKADDPQVRLTAALGMSRFGDLPALQELVQLAGHRDWTVRRDAVRAMGESGQTRLVEKLIAVVWTESNSTVKLTALESLDRLVASADRPAGVDETADVTRRIELWAAWWGRQQSGSSLPRPLASSE